MTKRSKILLAVAGSVVLALVALLVSLRICVNSQEKVNLTDNQVRQMIDSELPRGTQRSVVGKFLAGKGWPHGNEGSTTWATIRDAEHNFLI